MKEFLVILVHITLLMIVFGLCLIQIGARMHSNNNKSTIRYRNTAVLYGAACLIILISLALFTNDIPTNSNIEFMKDYKSKREKAFEPIVDTVTLQIEGNERPVGTN